MKNKEFILEYYNAISGHDKTPKLLARFITDPGLLAHIAFFEGAFPRYELTADEMTSEGNRVVVRCHCIGKHEGVFGDIPPTHRRVDFPFVVTYVIDNNKIISHWLIADQMLLLEQLGVEPALAAH